MKLNARALVTGLILTLSLSAGAQPQNVPWQVDCAQKQTGYGFGFDKSVQRWQTFYPRFPSLHAVAVYVGRLDEPGEVIVEVRDQKNQVLARATGRPEKAGWLYLTFAPAARVRPGEPYRLYVYADRNPTGPRMNFYWRGQVSSPFCPKCVSDVEKGWPHYRYAFVIYGADQ